MKTVKVRWVATYEAEVPLGAYCDPSPEAILEMERGSSSEVIMDACASGKARIEVEIVDENLFKELSYRSAVRAALEAQAPQGLGDQKAARTLQELRNYAALEMNCRPDFSDRSFPACAEDECGAFDGKRCRLIGFRPGNACEPFVRLLVDELEEVGP